MHPLLLSDDTIQQHKVLRGSIFTSDWKTNIHFCINGDSLPSPSAFDVIRYIVWSRKEDLCRFLQVWSCPVKFFQQHSRRIPFIRYGKQRYGLTAPHLTEQSECVSWWPRRFSDSRLISISADLPELTGVIVPTEYFPHGMKTYSFTYSRRIAPLELYICVGLLSWVTNWQSLVTTHLWEHGYVSANWHLNGLPTHCVVLRCQHLCVALTESQLWWIWHRSSLTLLLPSRRLQESTAAGYRMSLSLRFTRMKWA